MKGPSVVATTLIVMLGFAVIVFLVFVTTEGNAKNGSVELEAKTLDN